MLACFYLSLDCIHHATLVTEALMHVSMSVFLLVMWIHLSLEDNYNNIPLKRCAREELIHKKLHTRRDRFFYTENDDSVVMSEETLLLLSLSSDDDVLVHKYLVFSTCSLACKKVTMNKLLCLPFNFNEEAFNLFQGRTLY